MEEKISAYSDEKALRLGYLVSGYIRNILTEKELDELDEWITEKIENQVLFEELTGKYNIKSSLAFLDKLDEKKILASIKTNKNFP